MKIIKAFSLQIKMSVLISILLSFNVVRAAPLYEIEVEKVKLYKEPNKQQELVYSLYSAQNIEILKLKGPWAQVSFKETDKVVVGWVLKNKLSLQRVSRSTNELSKKLNSASVNKSEQTLNNSIQPDKDNSDFFQENNYGSKVISADLVCEKVASTPYISGCIANVDLDIIGPVTGDFVTILCKAEFEMAFEKIKPKQVWQQKVIRTPLKDGIGAARVHLAVIPLLEKQVTEITMLSQQCRLESVYTASND